MFIFETEEDLDVAWERKILIFPQENEGFKKGEKSGWIDGSAGLGRGYY